MKKLVPRVLHREHRYTLPFLCNERQNAVGEVRVDDDQFRLRHAHELLHLLERVVYLPVVEHFLRREFLVLHRIEYQLEALFVAGLRIFLFQLAAFCCLDAGQQGRKRGKRAAHGDERPHYLYVGCNCSWRTKNTAQHGNAIFRKCIREVFYVAASSAVQGANLAS